ncbi:LLM class flavin-dependent oxidoreductase, partial [Nocardia brasiliensis]|uniref:LLM class flavin-dependent oxidoreductase n=1 Tax=Nocardia brasiliensis TaxID=37326 RepID=UPI00245543A3
MKRFRTGLLDAGLHPRFTPDMLLRSSQMLAAAGGADSLWVPDHLISLQPQSVWTPKYVGAAHLVPRIHACYDPWLALGYLAAKNGLARKRLGIGVTDTGRRNPAVTAQAAATLHLLTGGRSILGIGPGERLNNEPFGVDWRTPVGRFEEAMATIRLLWDSDGAPVSRESPYFPLHNAVFDVPPYRGTRPEVWIAAHLVVRERRPDAAPGCGPPWWPNARWAAAASCPAATPSSCAWRATSGPSRARSARSG